MAGLSPGSVTERVHFYAAPYAPNDQTGPGDGLQEEALALHVHTAIQERRNTPILRRKQQATDRAEIYFAMSVRFSDGMSLAWSLRQALPSDASWIAELRADVMRPDLERLGRWDPVRVRQCFRDGFLPAHTFVIEVECSPVGVIAVRPERDEQWIEHFYLGSQYQGRGLGSEVLRHVMATFRDARPFRLNVLQGSSARRLYERHGFVHDHEDPIDVFLIAKTNGETGPANS